jgi:hypothetical protein
MRTFVKVRIPVEAGNKAINNGTLQRVIKGFQDNARPETMFFGVDNGCRTMFAVMDLQSADMVPRLFEPFFMEMNAEVDYQTVMNMSDLDKALSQLPKR